ncbi:MAG: class I SAM-dependent methyltransferase [Chitinophagaceae bacterium]
MRPTLKKSSAIEKTQLKSPLNNNLPANLIVLRGETQKDVNCTVLTHLANRFSKESVIKALDLPCGNMAFLFYLRALFPLAELVGADLMKPEVQNNDIRFVQMDLTKDFTLPADEQFDLITSISGIMMFSNTLSFIENCILRLKKGGTFVLTNDNSATIIDRLAFLFLGRFRIFKSIYEDTEELTENVPAQELCRLLRTHGVAIETIKYTSFYLKDIKYLPIALLVYPFQLLYLSRLKTDLPRWLKWQMYPFKHLFCKHYIIIGRKER